MTFKDNTVYRDMHYDIESGYRWGEGMSAEAHDRFYAEILPLFEKHGWFIHHGSGWGCPEVCKGWSKLYLHPMDASGAVAEDLVGEVADILSEGTTFTFKTQRDNGRLYNWTDEEYEQYLEETRREFTEGAILKALTTKRKNLYASGDVFSGGLRYVYNMIHVQRVSSHIGRSSDDVDIRYIERVRDELVAQGKIETAETRIGIAYRTAKGAIA